MEKRKLTRIAAAVLALVIVFIIYRWQVEGDKSQRQSIQTIKVERGTVAPTLAVTGYVAADERQISPTTASRIEEIYVKVGDSVKAGQNLLRLDDAAVHRELNIAAASLRSTKARLQELKDKAASAAEIAAQEAAVARATADYQSAEENHDALVIKSPIDGTVIAVAAAVGDQIGSSAQMSSGSSAGTSGGLTGVITVADLSKLYVKAAIDQADISKVAVGQGVKALLDALPGKSFSGQITGIEPVPEINQNVVTYTSYISFDKLDLAVRLGMSVDLEIDLGKKENVLILPNTAVRSRGDEKIVTKMIDGELTEVTVETGVSDSENVEITSGLSAGDRIALQSFSQSTERSSGGFGGPFGGGFGGRMMAPGR